MVEVPKTLDAREQASLPKTMKALQYSKPREYAVVQIPLPDIGPNDVLVKISACGVCGTDLHYHEGEFLAKFPLIPGHEATGSIVALGKNVTRLKIGQRIVADPLEPCQQCFYCQRGSPLHCTNITGFGGTAPGGFAEYCRYPATHVYPIPPHLSDLDAVLVEPLACASHGIERIAPRVGASVLVFGCGPTGMLLAQLLRLNGGCNITLASRGGPKLALAQTLQIADSYVCLSESGATAATQMRALAAAHPHGFDIVVEATGAAAVLEDALTYVRKGGKIVVYGVYGASEKIAWAPARIWENEITVVASFCCHRMFPVAIGYLEGRRVRVEGIASKRFRVEEWGECLEAVRRQEVVKAVIVFD